MQSDWDAVGGTSLENDCSTTFRGLRGNHAGQLPVSRRKMTRYAKPANPKFFPLIAKFFLRIDGGGLEGTRLCS